MTSSCNELVQALERRCLLSAGIDGIGVLGDSYSDEYQFFAPIRSSAANWVEQLADDSNVSFGAFSSTDPAGPQNAGFAYNFATSGSTSSQMIADGQHLNVAGLAASGAVDLATMFIGGNDFRDVFVVLQTQGIGPAQAALAAAVPTVITNITIAAQTILSAPVVGANPDINLVIATLPKVSYLPQIRALVASVPALAPFVAAVDGAMGIVNQYIHTALGPSPRIAVADFAALADDWMSRDEMVVAGVKLERIAPNPGTDPEYFFLGTFAEAHHPGTIIQGLMANMFATAANDAFGLGIQPLSQPEILENAGLSPGGGPGASSLRFFSSGRGITGWASSQESADEEAELVSLLS